MALIAAVSQLIIGGVASNGDAVLHYQIFGKGPDLLFVQSGPCVSKNPWIWLAESISKLGFRVISYDPRGCGKSSTHLAISLELDVSDIEAIRKHLKIERWIIYANGFGCYPAVEYAAKYKNRTRSLILTSPIALGAPPFHRAWDNIKIRMSKDFRAKFNESLTNPFQNFTDIQKWMEEYMIGIPESKFEPLHKAILDSTNFDNKLKYFRSLENLNQTDACKRIICPTLILHGGLCIYGDGVGFVIHKLIKNSEFYHYPYSGQYTVESEKDFGYNSAIEGFLKSK